MDTLFASVRKEADRRKASGNADRIAAIVSVMRPHQRVLEADRSRWIAVRSPRQAGKSTGVLLLVIARCEAVAGAEWVVVGLSRASIKRIYWGALKRLNHVLELGLRFNEQELIARFPNGATLYFCPGENIAEVEKLRGGRYHGAVVDECKSYPVNVFSVLVDDVLQPALNTTGGPLYLIGTPGDALEGEFYLATCVPPAELDTPLGKRFSNRPHGSAESRGKWSLHVWTKRDNDEAIWQRDLAVKEENGWADDHPTWRREYLGEWVANDNRRVYRYHPHLHDYRPSGTGRFGLAPGHEWRTLVGVDLGSVDGTAIVVWAYSPTSPGLWEVYSEKRTRDDDHKLNVATLAKWYRDLEAEYGPFEGGVSDHLPLVLDTLASEYQVYLDPAEKKEKVEAIDLFNADLDRRLIRVQAGSQLSQELRGNRWNEKRLLVGKREEDPATPNDLCDASLYGWRWANHRRARDRVEQPAPMSREWWDAEALRELEDAKRRARERDVPDYSRLDSPLEGDWWPN